jgi:DNA-binding response OmpR family regulator
MCINLISPKITILIVEPNTKDAIYLQKMLQSLNYSVIATTSTGKSTIKIAKAQKPNIILMNILLNDHISGAESAFVLKRVLPKTKIIFLTDFSNQEVLSYAKRAKVSGFLLKPYRDDEIIATIELALLKDENSPPIEKIQLSQTYSFNLKTKQLLFNQNPLNLSLNASKLIELLVKNRNAIVSYEQIIYHIWGREKNISALRALLYRLREQIHTNLIKNIKGIGYIISTRGYQKEQSQGAYYAI